MGNCIRTSKASALNREIEALQRKAFNIENEKVKLLLLGAGESGKSTLFKQMRLLYGKGKYTTKEKKSMIPIVRYNIVFNLCQLLEQNETTFELSIDTLQTWKSPEVQEKWKLEKRSNVQVQDSLEYFMEESNFHRIVSENYLPSEQDILRCRVRTSGIVEEEFVMEGSKLVLVDVGGQRNERRKWIHAFEDVDCIIFVAAISEYDQFLFEDNSVRRQDESISLFSTISNDPAFNSNTLILFLNKTDLFRTKLLTVPFRSEKDKLNLSYTGPTIDKVHLENTENVENSPEFEEIYAQSLCYIESLYLRKVPQGKSVYVKTTCATDTQQVKHIMGACKDLFLRRGLEKLGFSK